MSASPYHKKAPPRQPNNVNHHARYSVLYPSSWITRFAQSIIPMYGSFSLRNLLQEILSMQDQVVVWVTHPMTSSSAPAYSSSSSSSSCATELYSAEAWFLWIAKRVAMTSSGVKIAVLRSTTMKYIVKWRGVISSMLGVPGLENEGKIRRRSVPRPRTTYAICDVSARRSPGVRYSIHGRRRSVGVRRIRSECLGCK